MKQQTSNAFAFSVTKEQVAISFLGNILIGIGVAVLRVSSMGNDAYSAMNMSLSAVTPLSLGTFQAILNMTLIVVQLIWGRQYIGIGTLVNMFLLGYIVQYSIPAIEFCIGAEGSHSVLLQIAIMIVGIFVIALGIAIYQKVSAGVAPFDFLSLGMTAALPTPYFVNRMITDGACVLLALLPWMIGMETLAACHIGVGTVVCVCCLGPFVSLCDRFIVSEFLKQLS